MADQSGEPEALPFITSGSRHEAGGTTPDGGQGRASWPHTRLLGVLSAGSLLALLGLAAAWTPAGTQPRTIVSHSGRHLPVQAKWTPLRMPSFYVGRVLNWDWRHPRCLNAEVPSMIGSPVSLYECEERNSIWIWEVTYGTLRHADGICLDAPHPDAIGSEVLMGKCMPGLSGQMWDLIKGENMLKNRVTSKCVHVEILEQFGAKASLTMGECWPTGRHQKWKWAQEDPQEELVSSGVSLTSGWRGKIQSKNGFCVKAVQPETNGSWIVLDSCDGAEEGLYWSYAGTTNSFVSSTGLCIDLNKRWTRTDAHLWQCYPRLMAQKWGYDARTGLVAGQNGACLEAAQPSLRGDKVIAKPCHPGGTQQWVLLG